MQIKIRRKLGKFNRWRKRLWPKPPKLKFWYAWYYKVLPVKKNRVLFESFHGRDLSDSPYYILKALMDAGLDEKYEIYFSTMNLQEHRKIAEQLGLKVKLVDVTTFRYTRILATAKYLINNSSFPIYFIRRPEQIYLQTWHGTPLKTLGKQMRFGIESMYNIQHNFMHASYLMFPNHFTREAMLRDYNLDRLYTGEVVMCGYPRNSVFSDRESGVSVRHKLGLEGYETFAYMPTWRGQSNHDIMVDEQNVEIRQILKELDQSLRDDQKLFVNFHPIVASLVHLDEYQHIFQFPDQLDKYEFLNSVDCLITDYSSVFFDFSVTRKPIILFMYDYEQYMHDRGMYLDVRSLPFVQVFDTDSLKQVLSDGRWKDCDYSGDDAYISKFIPYDSIDSGEKMMRLVFEGNRDGLEFIDYSANKEKKWSVFWPKNCRTVQALDGVARTADPENELLVFEMRRFSPVTSAHLYDHYNDTFTYLFMINAIPQTVMEWCLRFLPFVQRMVFKRNVLRCFAALNVEPVFRTEYYHGEMDERFYYEEVPLLDASVVSDSSGLQITIYGLYREQEDAEDIFRKWKETKLLILDNSLIVWERPVLKAECKEHTIRENFSYVLENGLLRRNRPYQLGVEMTDKNGNPQLFYVSDVSKVMQARKKLTGFNRTALCYPSMNAGLAYLRGMERQTEVVITPYLGNNDYKLHIIATYPQDVVKRFRNARMKKIRSSGSRLKLSMFLDEDNYVFNRIELRLQNELRNVVFPIPCTVKRKGQRSHISFNVDFNKLQLEPMYWNLFVVVSDGVKEEDIECRMTVWQFKLLKMFVVRCSLQNGFIFFPYKRNLAFSYREKTPYDGWNGRFREFISIFIYNISKGYWKKRRIWLVYEKFCTAAQENGYYFFKYCMDTLPEEEKNHIYYILDKKSPDREKLSEYKDHILDFMSIRYMIYTLAANIYIAPDSRKHLYLWRARPNLMTGRQMKRPLFFLQHGVTALKRDHNIFGSKAPSRVSYFAVTSEFEQNIITTYFGYTADRVPITGFCRWDVLEDKAAPDDRMILIMPTWRMWLENNTEDQFIQSEYYKTYMSLLSDARLLKALKNGHSRIIFYIHPKLAEHLSRFHPDSDVITCIPFGAQPLNEIIMRCHMLVTDYSSVCWDAYYLAKPVLFFQFDRDYYIAAHGGGYMDFDKDLFGDVFHEKDELVSGMIDCMQNDFREKPEYAGMRPGFFAYRDNDNSKRTYRFLVEKGY